MRADGFLNQIGGVASNGRSKPRPVCTGTSRYRHRSCLLFHTRQIVPADVRASGEHRVEGDFWNREHHWPQRFGLRNTAAHADGHTFVPVGPTLNSPRGSRHCDGAGTPHHERTVCRVSGDAFESAPEVRTHAARIAVRVDVRHEGAAGVDVGDLSPSGDPSRTAGRLGLDFPRFRRHRG